MPAAPRVAIVGGGISGLATAFRLRERARDQGLAIEVHLFEAGPRPGGKVGSIREDGFLCEAGPTGFLDNEPATLRLVDDLGLGGDLLRSRDAARERYIFRNGRFHRLEMHPLRFMLSPLLSLRGRLRVAGEFFAKPRCDEDDETLGDFGRRRVGTEFVDVMLDSMVSGIFAGDVNRLSVQAAFPKVVELERTYGGLIRGMRARSKQAAAQGAAVSAGPSGVLHSFRRGMAQPIERLTEILGASVETNTEVRTLARSTTGRRYRLSSSEGHAGFDSVVLAVPGPACASLLEPLAPAAVEPLAGIRLAGVHVVCTGYERSRVAHPLHGFGALIPRSERLRILGTLWTSTIFEGRAPEGHVLLTTMIGGAHDPEAVTLTDEQLVALTRKEIDPIYGIDGPPAWLRVVRWPAGIPQYDLGHLGRLARARRALAPTPGVFLTGNSVAGVSFNQCVADAERVADEVVQEITRSASRTVDPSGRNAAV